MDQLNTATSPHEISSHSEFTRSKTRPRRPCDSCRKRKSRCEIAEGASSCVLCQFHYQPCTFVENPRPRKRKIPIVSEDEDVRKDTSTEASRVSQISPGAAFPRHDATAISEISSRSVIRQAPPVENYADLKGPSLLKKTLGLQNHRHSRYVGSSSEYEHSLLELDAFNDRDEIPAGVASLRKVSLHDTFILAPDAGTQNHGDEITELDAIETLVAPHGHALITLYFRIVHPSFPILHKKVYLEKYQRTHREFSPPLLAAVYILALQWWSFSDLALLPKPDVPRLEKLGLKTISDVTCRPKLSTIQAGLLLLQRFEGDSWALVTKLVGLGQDLGLQLDCTRWRIPSWERGLRKRLAWALFMQDKWSALVHGRPSHILADDWAVKHVTESDFPENAADEDDEDGSTEVEKGRILFSQMIGLTEILSDILSSFYTIRAEEETRNNAHQGVRWILEKAKPIQIRLKEWFAQLPDCLKMENLKMRKLSSTGYLHLAYYTAEITLHRRIVRLLAHESDPSLVSICRAAAKARLISAMDFVQGLRAEHLQSFWYSASRYCFALIGTFVSLLWVTSTNKEEADFYKNKLEEYRWILRLSSKSAPFLERAISTLATSTGVLIRAIPEKPVSNVLSPETADSREYDSQTTGESGDEAHADDQRNMETSPSKLDQAKGEITSQDVWMTGDTDMDAFGVAGTPFAPNLIGHAIDFQFADPYAQP